MTPAISLLMSPDNGDKIVKVAKEMGIDHFEIVCDKPVPKGINVISAQSLFNGLSIGNLFTDDETYEYAQILIKRINKYYIENNCHNFVFGSPKNRNIYTLDDFFESISFFRMVCHGIPEDAIVSLENNPAEYGTNYGTYAEQCYKIADVVNMPNFKVNLDLGGLFKAGDSEDVIPFIFDERWLVNHIHISRFNLLPISELSQEEIIAYQKVFQTIKNYGYDNTVSLEVNFKGKLTDDFIKKEITIFKEIIQ